MIAISYRREDSAPITGRIYDRLEAVFGRDRVFMDLDSIPFGVDFRTHISEALSGCETLLVVIGPHWLGPSEDGSRRIDDPTDFVRLEVAQALARDIRVIPLLIDRTEMPSSTGLPDDLKSLAFRNALHVDSGADFRHHIDKLCTSLQAARRSSSPPAKSYQPVATSSLPPAPGNHVPFSSKVEPIVSSLELAQLRYRQAKTFLFKIIFYALSLIFGILVPLIGMVYMDYNNEWVGGMIAIGLILLVVGIVGLATIVPPYLKRLKGEKGQS